MLVFVLKLIIKMFGKKKKVSAFGTISVEDDLTIQIHDFRKEARNQLLLEIFKLIRDVLLIIPIFILIGVFVVQPVIVEGTSMLPVLHDGERLLVNKLVYYKIQKYSWGHIKRGDIVVFWYPKDPNKSFVKRVIGLPGETIEIRNGIVYINGRRLYEKYLEPTYNHSTFNFPPKKIEEHHYFVMGDNRDNSSDSRYWGLVPEKYIYGKAFFRFWPSNIGFINKGEYELDFEKPNNVAKEEEEL